jgi:EAL domain-containing protein (putative c-di-GMP-specific phosphodiesterase class I)
MPVTETSAADRITVDEAGIESGIWGEFRLKSAYQPVFRLDGEALLPFAVEGSTVASLYGGAAPPGLFDLSVTRDDLALLGRIGRAIHIGNLQNVTDQVAPDLFLLLDADAFADRELLTNEIDTLSERLAGFAIVPDRLIFTFRGHAGSVEEPLAALAAAIRSKGMRVCIEEAGPVFSAPSLLAAIAPDFLRVGADRLRLLAREPQVQRMVRSMFASLAERGIATLVDGIDSSEDFVAALDAGALCFQGSLLAEPRRAGTLFDLKPLPVESLRARRDNVVPLFRARSSSN